jgi:hypothetical protein
VFALNQLIRRALSRNKRTNSNRQNPFQGERDSVQQEARAPKNVQTVGRAPEIQKKQVEPRLQDNYIHIEPRVLFSDKEFPRSELVR